MTTRTCETCGASLEGRTKRAKFCGRLCYTRSDGYRERNRRPGTRSGYMLRYLYGITEDEFSVLLEKQGGVCAICGSAEWAGTRHRVPHVDHDHESGRIRGLLCGRCNFGLGKFGDDPDRLRAAARYLEEF